MHLWLLAPNGVDRTAHRTFDGGGYDVGVAPLAWRQALEGLEDRVVDQSVDRCAFPRALWQAGDHHIRVARHFAPRCERDRDRYNARKTKPAALADGFLIRRQQNRAVLRPPPARHFA